MPGIDGIDGTDNEAVVLVFGGTISCGEKEEKTGHRRKEKRIVVKPERGKIEQMIRNDVSQDLLYHFKNGDGVEVIEVEPILDSAGFVHNNVENVSRRTRLALNSQRGSVIACLGTDTADEVLEAMAEGTPPDLLEERSLIAALAKKHASPNRPKRFAGPFYQRATCEPLRTLEHALFLAIHRRMRGAIGAVLDHELLRPRGLRKLQADGSITSRFPLLGVWSGGPINDWDLDQVDWSARGRGKEHPYILQGGGGIEAQGLGTTAMYQNIIAQIYGDQALAQLSVDYAAANGRKKKEKVITDAYGVSKEHLSRVLREPDFRHRLRGLVLQAPGQGNLRQDKPSLRMLAAAVDLGYQHGIPVAVIANPVQRQPDAMLDADNPDQYYGGNLAILRPEIDRYSTQAESPIIDGGYMTGPEARIVMCHAVARGRKVHKHKGPELVNYVSKYISTYLHWLATGEETPLD